MAFINANEEHVTITAWLYSRSFACFAGKHKHGYE
jgi:hypothetical protein